MSVAYGKSTMADDLNNAIHRELNINDANKTSNASYKNSALHVTLLSRKISDNNGGSAQHQRPMQSVPVIKASEFRDASSPSLVPVPRILLTRQNSASGYDTDGAVSKGNTVLKRPTRVHSNYEHLISPRLSSRKAAEHGFHQAHHSSSRLALPQSVHRRIHSPVASSQTHEDKEELNDETDATRQHVGIARHNHQPPPSPKKHGLQGLHSPTSLHHDISLTATPPGRPFRIIFMRHSERVNQALGSDWFMKAYRTGTYKAYDPNLPTVLPKRRFLQAYEFDSPLTVRGLKAARLTGRAILNMNQTIKICLSSTALRCIQTCERVLSGMDRRDVIPIRIEPGLFECPHLNAKITDSFMTKAELVENGYNIKMEYKPLIRKVSAPESLEEYFQRCAGVMRGIIDRYSPFGGAILLVTHAPGLLALTDSMKGLRPTHDNFYHTVATYPPLAVYIADFDGTKWSYSEQPFSISFPAQ